MLLFDIETDGLLDTVSKIHCLVIKDTETGKTHTYTAENMMEGVGHLQMGTGSLMLGIAGHNVIKYDIPVIKKLYPWFEIDESKVFDTLVATRLIWSNIKDHDTGLLKKQQLPGKLFGSHSLEAWGYRLKLMKGEYKDDFKARMGDAYVPGMEWLEFSQEMLDYCIQDVEVTHALYKKILDKDYSQQALELEHQVAWLLAQMERNGFPFDVAKASTLYAKLAQRRGELERQLKDEFKFWFAPEGGAGPIKATRKVWHQSPMGAQQRRYKPKGKDAYYETGWYEEFEEGLQFQKIKEVEFNPGSRDHIADRLMKLYGWKPEVFTDGGKPKVEEDIIGALEYPPCKLLNEYLTVAKRVSQLAEGDQAWLKVEKQGKIHGSINPNGAVTGRAIHSFPNVGQVPANGSLYGHECRELFGVPKGWHMVGTDASGLELRCLAHFMARYDSGKYVKVLLEGDIHTENQHAAGLPTRNNAKTFILRPRMTWG